jgi:hypothetical protein
MTLIMPPSACSEHQLVFEEYLHRHKRKIITISRVLCEIRYEQDRPFRTQRNARRVGDGICQGQIYKFLIINNQHQKIAGASVGLGAPYLCTEIQPCPRWSRFSRLGYSPCVTRIRQLSTLLRSLPTPLVNSDPSSPASSGPSLIMRQPGIMFQFL